MKKNNLEIVNKILKEENKKLCDEIKRLKLKYEMIEMLNFYLLRKVVLNEKNSFRC